MQPNISEFSYGYALTDELVHGYRININSAPIFPSLYEEGQNRGGYDLLLDTPGLPLFLQFKLSHYLFQANSKEIQDGTFNNPYYRMYITRKLHSNQHEMLYNLEMNDDLNQVFYTAPLFYQPQELNFNYLNGTICENSLWIKPSEIGILPDNNQHYIVFDSITNWYFCSKPKKKDFNVSFKKRSEEIKTTLKEKGNKFSKNFIENLALDIEELSQMKSDINQNVKNIAKQNMQNKHPIEKIAFYSKVFLNSDFYIIKE